MRNALTWRTAIGLAAGLGGMALLPSRIRSADTSVTIVFQYGIGYLPVMASDRLGFSSPKPRQMTLPLKRPRSKNRFRLEADFRGTASIAGDGGTTMAELADDAGVTSSYFARVIRLAFLSPQLTAAILTGRHPVTLTANKLQHLQQLPNAWAEQAGALASA